MKGFYLGLDEASRKVTAFLIKMGSLSWHGLCFFLFLLFLSEMETQCPRGSADTVGPLVKDGRAGT